MGANCQLGLHNQHQALRLKEQTLIASHLGSWNPRSRCLRAGPSWCLSCACRHRLLPMSSRGRPPVWVRVLISSSYKDTRPIGSGSHPGDLISPNDLCKDPASTYSGILWSWGLGLQHMNLGGMQFSHSRTTCFTVWPRAPSELIFAIHGMTGSEELRCTDLRQAQPPGLRQASWRPWASRWDDMTVIKGALVIITMIVSFSEASEQRSNLQLLPTPSLNRLPS